MEVLNYICKPYFKTELGELYLGDCLKLMDFLIEKNVQVDAIITDPPYATTKYSWDNIIPFKDMWERLLKLIKPNGAIVMFGNEPFSSLLRNSNKKNYRYDWKWIKTQVTGFQMTKFQPLRCYEDVMVFSKASAIPNGKVPMCYYPQGLIKVDLKVTRTSIDYLKEKKDNKKMSMYQEYTNYPRNILQFSRDIPVVHPTQKPCNLLEYLILTYTKENEVVLDFTCGSGSTLLTCEILNRKWIGIELQPNYCELTKKRIQNGLQLKILFNDFKEV